MPKKKTKAVEVETDEDAEEYVHGSLLRGDTPPAHVAAHIAHIAATNPFAHMTTDELTALARELREAGEQLRLVEAVLLSRSSVW